MVSQKSPRPADRVEALRLQQTLKMARSAHAYVRGSTVKFYEWLEAQKSGTLPEGPAVWICGDCHAGNLGPVAATDGRVAIQIRDLDQTVIGNPAHDIIRLALSLATASRGSDLPGVTTAHILEQVIEGYQAALRQDADAIDDAPKSVQIVMKQSVARSWKQLANERLDNLKPTIPLGSKFWGLSKAERGAIAELFQTPSLRHLATSLRSRDDDAPVEVLDAAYWMKGCSSLGLLRFAVLLTVGSGKKRDMALMDVKEAVTAAAPRYAKQKMPNDQAERVVGVGRHCVLPSLAACKRVERHPCAHSARQISEQRAILIVRMRHYIHHAGSCSQALERLHEICLASMGGSSTCDAAVCACSCAASRTGAALANATSAAIARGIAA